MKCKALIERYCKENPYMKPNPPASETQIMEVEKRLNVSLPHDLKNLLMEFDGDNWLLFSTSQIIETNELQRSLDCFMPLDCLLFIAGNGCGDYYGYPISRDGLNDSSIFMWEHENDSRRYVAYGLEDLIEKYYTDKV